MFASCNVKLDSFWNKMRVIGHQGPHGRCYNDYVYKYLKNAVEQAPLGQKSRNFALRKALTQLKREIRYNGLDALLKVPSHK